MDGYTFIGREAEVRLLADEFQEVARTQRGRFVLIRGRRRVGKSRLVEEFIRREAAEAVFFAASRQSPERELALFQEAIAGSTLRAAELVRSGLVFNSWEAALTLVANGQTDAPAVVVLDEFPYLIQDDQSIEGAIQKAWDRSLQDRPILLIVVGSDLGMMNALADHAKPLFGRPTRYITVAPFSPLETAEMIGIGGAEALEAYLAVGGFPLLAGRWVEGQDLWGFLQQELADATGPLVVSGERTLAAELPTEMQARQVLAAIGSGEATFAAIGRKAGVAHTSLQRTLALLAERGIVEVTSPLSTAASRERRYVVSDPYFRFWLRFIGPAIEELERGRGALVVERMKEQWADYVGRAIEPIVRASVTRLLPDPQFGRAQHSGSYWTRQGDLEVDLVGADRPADPTSIDFVGSIKWRSRRRFTSVDLAELKAHADAVPGATGRTKLVGVSKSGFDVRGLDVELDPGALLNAWRDDTTGGAARESLS